MEFSSRKEPRTVQKALRVLIIPDSFKGSLTSATAADAIEAGFQEGLARSPLKCFCTKIPISDGGEGFVQAILAAIGGSPEQLCRCTVEGPFGSPVVAEYAITKDGRTAYIESASACGLTLVHENDRNPGVASTFGVGQLIATVAKTHKTVKRFILGVGGTCTNDGGAGMMSALGVEFFDTHGLDIGKKGGLALRELREIRTQGIHECVRNCEFIIATDVKNRLVGKCSASRIFASQKGATYEMSEQLEIAMVVLGETLMKVTGVPVSEIPGSGAGGGLAAPLMAFARTCSVMEGFKLIAENAHLERIAVESDLIITGEGQFDEQSITDKVVAGICSVNVKTPIIVLVGGLKEPVSKSLFDRLMQQNVHTVLPIVPGPTSLTDAIASAEVNLRAAARNAAAIIALGYQQARR